MSETCSSIHHICVQVLHAEQQKVLRRTKRTVVHDKQIELPIRHFDDKSIYQRYHTNGQRISTKDTIPGVDAPNDMGFNDPFFNDQWYLVGSIHAVRLYNTLCSGLLKSWVTLAILDQMFEIFCYPFEL